MNVDYNNNDLNRSIIVSFDQEWPVEPDWEENDQKTCDKKMIENENTAQFEKPDEIENSQNHDKQMINKITRKIKKEKD